MVAQLQFLNINVIPLVERKDVSFLLRYITLSYLNWLQNGKLLNLEVQKKCLKYDDLCSKMHLFQALFLDFQIQQLTILRPVEVGKSYIPQKKAL